MGHRALLARERADGNYDLYYSHWGGADLSLARDADREPWAHPQVDPDPLATGVEWNDLLAAHLDPLCHEALFVLPQAGAAAAYRPFWPVPLESAAPLVAVDPADPEDDAYVQGIVTGAREALVAAFEAGALDAGTAGTAFRRTVTDHFDNREVAWLDEVAFRGEEVS